jgi:protein-S-isoprenylcysteine O-methyltransferase Ste14
MTVLWEKILMKNITLLKVVNPVLAVLVLNQPFSGFLYSWTNWEAFEIMHVGGGILLFMFAAIHLMLNWKWVQVNLLNSSKKNKRKAGPETLH